MGGSRNTFWKFGWVTNFFLKVWVGLEIHLEILGGSWNSPWNFGWVMKIFQTFENVSRPLWTIIYVRSLTFFSIYLLHSNAATIHRYVNYVRVWLTIERMLLLSSLVRCCKKSVVVISCKGIVMLWWQNCYKNDVSTTDIVTDLK